MIPTIDEILAAHEFVARRFGVDGRPNVEQIAMCLDEARAFADNRPADEPAALFYVLTRRPRAIGGLWRALPLLLSVNQAREGGLRVDATEEEWRSVRLDIVSRRASFGDVREWFAKRLSPTE